MRSKFICAFRRYGLQQLEWKLGEIFCFIFIWWGILSVIKPVSDVRFEVFTLMIQVMVFWVATPCGGVGYQHFGNMVLVIITSLCSIVTQKTMN
jgi:hypothetical protein